MSIIFSNWTLFRAIRLVLGLGILIYGYSVMDWLLILIGTTITIMSLTNTGCSPYSNSCAVDVQEKKKEIKT